MSKIVLLEVVLQDGLKCMAYQIKFHPVISGLDVGNIQSQKLVKIIEECWSPQPILRLTGAQLFWKMKENFPENAIQSPIRTSYH